MARAPAATNQIWDPKKIKEKHQIKFRKSSIFLINKKENAQGSRCAK